MSTAIFSTLDFQVLHESVCPLMKSQIKLESVTPVLHMLTYFQHAKPGSLPSTTVTTQKKTYLINQKAGNSFL